MDETHRIADPSFPARAIFEWDARWCLDGEGVVLSRNGKTRPSLVIVNCRSAPGPRIPDTTSSRH